MDKENERIQELLKNFQVKRVEPIKKTIDTTRLCEYQGLQEQLAHADKVLVGIGAEWRSIPGAGGWSGLPDNVQNQSADGRKEQSAGSNRLKDAYDQLFQLLDGRDYFIVTTNTDAQIFNTNLDAARITAPCGNETWRQCSRTCTKDIWEPGEIPDDICPHCGAPLIGNTMEAAVYIEEGYLPQWQRYTHWLTTTLNQKLLVLELGEGFKTPTVIRWPFEKTVLFNQKSFMYRVHEKYAQLADGMQERAVAVSENSVDWILGR